MSPIGSPDLGAAVTSGPARGWRAYGGGPHVLGPVGGEVLTSADGSVLWRLDLARTLSGPRVTFSCTVGARYDEALALAALRETDPRAAVTAAVLTDWTFRVDPRPLLATSADLTTPIPMTSDGLGAGRLLTVLTPESGLVLESLLRDGGSLPGTAEATVSGVAPRVPVVVRFDPAVLSGELLALADAGGALPYAALVAAFRRDAADLPIEVSGDLEPTATEAFAHAVADRLVARSGHWIPGHDPADGPVVRLDPGDPGTVTWSLSQPQVVRRRVRFGVDLLGAAHAQARDRGVDSLVVRRDLGALPSTGDTRVTVLATLPASRPGVDVLGVELEFPPAPPARPQPRWTTAVFEDDDVVEVDVRLAPGEPVRYVATPFAVVVDADGTRRVDGTPTVGTDPVLRLGPDAFGVELAACAAAPGLVELAVVHGTCTYAEKGADGTDGAVRTRRFTLDAGHRETVLPVPLTRAWLRIDVVAEARDGSGTLVPGPFESAPVRLDLGSFPTYGPRQVTVRAVFDDGAPARAVTLLPDGVADTPENATVLLFTALETVRTFRWFARTPFGAGLRFRPHDDDGAWSRHDPADGDLVLFASPPVRPPARREVRVREGAALLRGHRRPGGGPGDRETDAVAESAVVPVARTEHPVTEDQVLSRIDPPGAPGYLPRYELDLQTVSGRREYRIAMDTDATTSTLTVHLVATVPPAVASQEPGATELPHTLDLALEFLLLAGGGATKTLLFTDVTRNGSVVTAVLTFATLAERDDVYGALTDPARGSRLVARRTVALLVRSRSAGLPMITFPLGPFPFIPLGPILSRPFPLPVPIVLQPGPFGPPDPIFQPDPIFRPDPSLGPGGRARMPESLVGAGNGRPLTGVAVGRAREQAARGTPVLLPDIRFRPRDDVVFPRDLGEQVGPVGPPAPSLPLPVLSVQTRETEPGWTRFRLAVDNWASFPDELFAAAPDLPPCGQNTSSSRTWVDILDAGSGARIYGFCALGAARNLLELWFAVADGSPVPGAVQVRLEDRRTRVAQVSAPASTAVPEPREPEPTPEPEPTYEPATVELSWTVAPEQFWFSPALHGYIFRSLVPSAGANRMIRHTVVHHGRSHTYLQDASRPSLVYVFPDEFRIARRPEAPFTPLVAVRVRSSADGSSVGVVVDYVIAPHLAQDRLLDARARLLADPRFEADSVEFQPFTTSEVTLTVDRPTESGSVREVRPDAALVLQGALKDTLSMPLEDFRLLFDAMVAPTATMFVGHVAIATGDGAAETIPFTGRMDALEGPVFGATATTAPDGLLDVRLTSGIESPLDVQTLGVSVVDSDGRIARGLVRDGLPREGLLPGESVVVRVEVEEPAPSAPSPELVLDLAGVRVRPDPAAIWNAVLDRSTLEFFRLVTVRVVASAFDSVPGQDHVIAVVVAFEGGGSADLRARPEADAAVFVEATVRIDYPIDDVILRRPVSREYRYTRTVVWNDGRTTTAAPVTGTADQLYVDVAIS